MARVFSGRGWRGFTIPPCLVLFVGWVVWAGFDWLGLVSTWLGDGWAGFCYLFGCPFFKNTDLKILICTVIWAFAFY